MVGSKHFVFSGRIGRIGRKPMNDMWTLNLNCRTFAYSCSEPFWPDIPAVKSQPLSESYEPTQGNEKPLPRFGHVSVATEDRMIMFVPSHLLSTLVIIFCRFGGQGDRRHNDTWSFDISTRKWTELQCNGSIPSPREYHAAVLINDVMYVFGGLSMQGRLDDLYALQLSSE